ncbi:competence protein ComEC [Blastomonas natatoria]|uniref:Competence protein ComEC n=1 Tax=Blastomonas natatoria TaxID=34015 RepID=A0A2V3USU4_9SPHN|nr:ComEC/Rec2 family competence protein [Blastomonas natatoria]PXW71326.1 competence protein ComEC [Blastomonas natatoria]
MASLQRFSCRTPAVAAIGRWLLQERDQLPVWIVVSFGAGIASWFLLPSQDVQFALIALSLAGAMGTLAVFRSWARMELGARCLFLGLLMLAAGCAHMAWRAERVGADPLAAPWFGPLTGRVVERESLPARNMVRLVIEPVPALGLPHTVRVNLGTMLDHPAVQPGAIVTGRARLMPPAQAALPGGYSFAQRAWFEGLGATGSMLDRPRILRPGTNGSALDSLRARLSAHIQASVPGRAGGIAATLATGDRGAISEQDAEAMRSSGLAHLLSISGLHVTALIGAVWLLTLRLLALFPPLARAWRLPLVAAGAGALAGIAYTLLTGAEVPTIRSCAAALLVLLALALGRDPVSPRLIAAGAMLVLLIWPETLMGPSFQLSFAAVTAIVALHDHPVMRRWAGADLSWPGRAARFLAMTFLTGLLIEFTLMPIALHHFGKAGLYGALANMIAIPLTTFIIMPLEAMALLLDPLHLSAPFWWLAGTAIRALIDLAHAVADTPGAVALFPRTGGHVFALFVVGGLWLALWRTRWRWLGLVPAALASFLVAVQPVPDLLVTGDGQHVAINAADGPMVLLRRGTGEYALQSLSEGAAFQGQAIAIEDWPGARCNADFCSLALASHAGNVAVLIGRSRERVPERALAAACRRADIVIAGRWLPKSCRPRWLKADRAMLGRTGGLAIYLGNRTVRTVARDHAGHPWWDRAMTLREEHRAKALAERLSTRPR